MSSDYSEMRESERQVADFLSNLGLWWRYEAPVFVFDEKERPRVWAPDFYIPKLGIYVEVCGSEDFNYDYRRDIYEKNNLSVIFVHHYKTRKWQRFLIERIVGIEMTRHQKVADMIDSLKAAFERAKLAQAEE